jgi:folate-binding protein YgfZ
MSDNQFIVTSGYRALEENQAYVDVSERGRIRVTGEDRARLLHALTTNHVQQMKPGEELYAFFLTAQGRIVSDVHVTCGEDHFLLDVEPEVRETLVKHIDHYIIADDVTLEDVTGKTFALMAGGKRVYGDLAAKEDTIAKLGLLQASADDARIFRIERFHPRFGEDFTSTTLPQETGLAYALHFNKGCYLGQEIVERIRSRGHVNRQLVGLTVENDANLEVGSKVDQDGTEIGRITSWTRHPESGSRAIAMLRVQAAQPGAVVQVEGVNARVSAVS